MNRFHIAPLPLAAFLLLAGNAWSAPNVITFDEFFSIDLELIPDGYFGFDWDNMGTVNVSFAPGSGYENGVVSGGRTAFNGGNNQAAMKTVSGDPFNFIGAYFTGAWNNGLSIKVDGYLDGSLEYTSTFQVNATGPNFVALNFANVDELRFNSFGGIDAGLGDGSGTHFAMDDLTFTVIPEPSSLVLSIGALGLVSLRRRLPQTSHRA